MGKVISQTWHRFTGMGMGWQALCVGLFVLGYLFPLGGVVVWGILKWRKAEPVWGRFSLLGIIAMAVVYAVSFAYLSATGALA